MGRMESGPETKIEKGPEGLEKKVIGVDLDDTLFWREVGIRYFGHLKNVLRRPALPNKTLDEIPQYDHTPYDIPASGIKERVSRVWHSRRTEISGMAEMVSEELAAGTDVYGITGRRTSKGWFEMTDDQLRAAKIKLTGIRMTPKGVSGILSKADSIRELGITDFYEDDRRTVRYLARLFPDVKFHYADHGLAHLSKKETMNTNIEVIPIREFAPPEKSKKGSVVRNSKLRELTSFIDPAVASFHKKFPKVKAWHVTAAGVILSCAGIHLAEHQNRTGKHSVLTTSAAFVLGGVGASMDVIDGKVATVIRAEMTDEKKRARHETIGQAIDPVADGLIEAFQAGSAAYTAHLRGNRLGTKLALLRLATTNLPRTAKALAGWLGGFKLMETYGIKDVLRGDIRFFGTSLGRKVPNYAATLASPVQKTMDALAGPANILVTADRLGVLMNPKGELALSDKDIEHAKVRTLVLGVESAAFIGTAYFLGKKLLKK